MNQCETGIFECVNRGATIHYDRRSEIRNWPGKKRIKTATMLFCMSVAGLGPVNVLAQQSLVVDINVFGVNSNQETASQQLISSCAAMQNDTSEAALDLLKTCTLINDLDPNDPDDVVRLQEILDIVAPEEAFTVNDSIVYVSDYQTTNVHSRINSLRNTPSSGVGDTNEAEGTGDAEDGDDAQDADDLEEDDDAEDGDDTNAGDDTDAETVSQSQAASGLYLQDGGVGSNLVTSGGGAAAGNAFSRLGVFFSGQLSSGDVDGSTFEQNTDINSSSFTAVVDYRFTDRVVAGLGVGVLQNEAEFSNVDGGTDSDGFNLTAFGSWYEEDKGYVDVVLDFGANSHDLERSIGTDPSAPVLAQASTDSSAFTFSISAGRYFAVNGWDLGGYARLSLTDGTIDGYTERASNSNDGSGSVFSFDSQSIKSTRVAIGAEASRVISTSKAVLIPLVRIEYESENEDKKDDLTATLVASQISTAYRGSERDASYANLGIGGSAVFQKGRSAYLFYETHLQHDFVTQNWLKFGLRLEFQ